MTTLILGDIDGLIESWIQKLPKNYKNIITTDKIELRKNNVDSVILFGNNSKKIYKLIYIVDRLLGKNINITVCIRTNIRDRIFIANTIPIIMFDNDDILLNKLLPFSKFAL